VKNRMLEIGAYGTVRGEGGNILTYSETCALMPREKPQAVPIARAKVPKRSAGAEQPVVVVKAL
jgi:hypothetical protein